MVGLYAFRGGGSDDEWESSVKPIILIACDVIYFIPNAGHEGRGATNLRKKTTGAIPGRLDGVIVTLSFFSSILNCPITALELLAVFAES